jgi:arginase family enzyme
MARVDLSAVPNLRPPPEPPRATFDDPDFVRASDWLARGDARPNVLVVGAPFAGGSISRARCDLAPAAVRAALARFSVWSSDDAISLEHLRALDCGDVEPESGVEQMQARVRGAVAALRGAAPDAPVVLLGGDNSVTVGGARGAGADGLITFDAHHDCRDPKVAVTNGSPVRQLVDGGIGPVVQIGIHGFANAEAHARWALDHKVHVILGSRVRDFGVRPAVEGALRFMSGARRIWVDFDLDVLDRAFAPGAPGALPGGLTPSQLCDAAYLLGKEPRVVGIDLVEADPESDVADATVRAAAAVMLRYLAGVASR